MPFLRMLIPLILGILVYKWMDVRSIAVPIIALILLVVYRVIYISRLSFENRYWYGYLLQIIVVLFGYSFASYQDAQKDACHFSNYIESEDAKLYGVITAIKERASRYEAVFCIHKIIKGDTVRSVTGKLNAFIPYSLDSLPSIGVHVGLVADIIEHPPPRNPEIFDYGSYLEKQGIYHQTKSIAQIQKISTCASLRYTMWRHRNTILESLHQHIDDEKNYGIAASILLGYRDAVDYETKTAFAETGSIHILAVSGMHVGIIWFFAGLLINRINNRRSWYKYLRVGLSVCVIWAFVFLVGLPPSAVRAAWLFSLVSAAQLLQGDSNLYHRLAIAAFAMLCWNTNYLFDVGFQLSFAAVLGIAAFHPIWDRLYYFKDKFRRYFWNGLGMTLGATLGTMPLTMYYFQYFPISGLFSSVFVVLIATIILGLGVIYLLGFWLTAAGINANVIMESIGLVMNHVLTVLRMIVDWFYSIPTGIITGISLSILAVVLLYVLFISLRLLWSTRHKAFIYSAVVAILALSSMALWKTYQTQELKQLVFYHDYRHNAIELYHHGQSLLIADETIPDRQLNYINKGLQVRNQVSHSDQIIYESHSESQAYYFDRNVLKFYDCEVLFVRSIEDLKGKEIIDWDYVVLLDNAEISIEEIHNRIPFEKIILGASNWSSKIDQWRRSCQELNIPYVDIRNAKALVINLNNEEA